MFGWPYLVKACEQARYSGSDIWRRVTEARESIKRWSANFFICSWRGHRSTGLLMWWMCDRCHADFTDTARPSVWVNNNKITTSPPRLRLPV